MLDQYKPAIENLGRLVAGVTPEQMSSPTPCPKLDVRGLLNHIVGGQHMLADAADGKRIDPSQSGVMPDVIGDDPAGAYERSSKLVLEAFAQPGVLEKTFDIGPGFSGLQALGIALMEAVVHGWDLAQAIGQDPGIDPAVADMLLAASRGFVTEQFRSPDGNPFGPPVEVDGDATPVDRLVAFLGRQP